MGDSQYSFSLTTFSPSGKLVQIEHALTAVGSGQTSLGIKAANGVVIATEKKLPSNLVDETSVCVTSSLSMTSSQSNSIICSSGTSTNKIPNANL